MDDGIYTESNPYGYRLNVNHPKVNELYRRFKVWKGIPYTSPMSDTERFEFEEYVLSRKENHA